MTVYANSGGVTDTGLAHDFRSHSSSYSPTGTLRETFDRVRDMNNLTAQTSGRLYLYGLHFEAGDVVSNLIFHSATTAMGTPTNHWAGLFTSARVALALSADKLDEAWAANSDKTFALSAAQTISTSGLHYVGLMVAAGTVPTLNGVLASNAAVNGVPPILAAFADSGLTSPPALPFTAASLTATTVYAWVRAT